MPLGFCLSDFCVSLFTVLLPLFIPYMSVLLRCPDQVSCCYSLGFLRTILSIVLTSAPISWWHPHFCFPLCISLFGSRFTWLCVHLGLPQASQTQHIPIWTHHHKPSSLLCCLFQWMAPPSTPPSYKPGSHPWLTQSPGPIGPASLLPGELCYMPVTLSTESESCSIQPSGTGTQVSPSTVPLITGPHLVTLLGEKHFHFGW